MTRDSKRGGKAWWWLFLAPLLVPALLWGVQRQRDRQITNHDVGGYPDEQSGERKAMQKLAQLVREGHTTGQVGVKWTVSILESGPQRGMRSTEWQTRTA